ncbi:MAG: KH domain-containing protein, partial [Candidatus Thermoplasmatota archaeon]
MAEITFTEETIQYVRLFSDLTQTTVLDCVETADRLIFVVKAGEIARAIGKGGEHVQMLRRQMNKEIHLVEYN